MRATVSMFERVSPYTSCRTESASLGADRYKVQTRVPEVQTWVPKVQTLVPQVQTRVELLKMLEVDMQSFL